MKSKTLKPVIRWLFLGYFLIFTMVIVGGITRLTGSGLSMADWKPIIGAIPPLNESDWLEKFELYKSTPEYIIKNNHFSLSEFKSIFWWEFIHRDLGRLIGLIFIIPFIIFWIQKRFDASLLKKMFIILGLGSLQGLLGWYMVKSGLVDEPNVSHFRLAAHFSTALTAMLYVFWVAITIIFPDKTPNTSLNKKIKFLVILIIGQIIYGAFTAGMDAGYGYTKSIFALPEVMKNIINDGETILFIHRYLAGFIFIYASYVYFSEIKNKAILSFQRLGLMVMYGTLITQILLGVFTLIYSVPINLGVMHQAVAVVLLTSCVYLIKRT